MRSRGMGAMNLQRVVSEADKLCLPVYLEGSKTGLPLYERWGFKSLRVLPFDSTLYGSAEYIDHTVMRRPAKESNGEA